MDQFALPIIPYAEDDVPVSWWPLDVTPSFLGNDIKIATSIDEIGRDAWTACQNGLEGYDYYRAVERSGIPGFAFRYIALRLAGEIRAVAPVFLCDYPLAEALDGLPGRIVGCLARLMPSLLTLRLCALGSPVSEGCEVGFAHDADGLETACLTSRLIDALELVGRQERAQVIAVKDLPDGNETLKLCLARRGFHAVPSLPTATLALPYASFDDYLASFGRATRKDLKRKMRSLADLRIEKVDHLGTLLPLIEDLYAQTWERSDLRLERLPAAYFSEVLAAMPGRAVCFLYWQGPRLVAFNLVLVDGERMIDKYLGMDYAVARDLNLYFVSWLTNVRHCIETGIRRFQSGQSCTELKLRLHSRLTSNTLHFRHRNPLVQTVLGWLSRSTKIGGGGDA